MSDDDIIPIRRILPQRRDGVRALPFRGGRVLPWVKQPDYNAPPMILPNGQPTKKRG